MNRKLYLIRHSYAESPAGGSDFNRTLTSEGQNTARELGRYLVNSSFNPTTILCSTATRATETVQNLIEELEINEKNVDYKEVIYNASVRELLAEVNQIDKTVKELAIVGHNPTITYFAEYLTGETIGNMDPCGLATITITKTPWEEVSQASGKLESYFHPKQLNV